MTSYRHTLSAADAFDRMIAATRARDDAAYAAAKQSFDQHISHSRTGNQETQSKTRPATISGANE